MTVVEAAAVALLSSLVVPAWALRRRWLPALRRPDARVVRRNSARLSAVAALLLLLSTPAGFGAGPAFAGSAAPLAADAATPTPTAAASTAATPAPKTTPAASSQTTAAQKEAEPGLNVGYGPEEPYYSDVLAGWQKQGVTDATQTIDLPVLKYSDSNGGTYCQPLTTSPNAATGPGAQSLSASGDTCVPASPGSQPPPATVGNTNPEAGNVQNCVANINDGSGQQGYCNATIEGKSNVLLWNNEDGYLTWKFDVPQAGLYNLEANYYNVPGKDATIGREVLIDDKFQYLEAHRVAFDRVWVNAGPVTVDNQGNDIRPPVKEQHVWQTQRANDSLGMSKEPLRFYLSAGSHTLKLNAIREPMALAKLQFVPPLHEPAYQQALAQWQTQGLKSVDSALLTIQTEDATARNDPTIRDESSNDPFSEPYSFGHFRLNTYGGYRWRLGGQWVEWTVGVPQDGLYSLHFRANQSGNGHMNVYRDIQVDNQFQYQELKAYPFPFDINWENVCICDPQGHPYLFHLTRGTHILKLTDRVGPIVQTVQDLQTVVAELGYWQRRIELITGQTPDPNLDYQLPDKMPELLPAFRGMAAKLDANVQLLATLNGGNRPDTANTLLTVADYLRQLLRRTDTIATNVENLDNQGQSLATWLLNVQQEPVWVDRFYLAGASFQPPTAEAPLWEQAIFTVRNLLGSFVFNYTGIGSIYKPSPGHPVIDVWTAWPQEYGLVLKDLIETEFTPQTGVYVNLHIFPPGALGGAQSVLLLALTSGAAPDLATGVDANTPVEFAIRKAIYPLDTLPGYKETASQFRPGALVQFQYPASGPDTHIYALPETQDFNMLFVRTDIMQALGIKPPQTWQDVYDMMPTLQQNGMEFFYSTSVDIQTGGFSPFLFQHGGAYYTPDGLQSALDTPQALAAFKQWTELYTDYRVPVQANFYNRFRTGEMPVGVSGYSDYVSLSVAAPELIGRWRMLPMPGTQTGSVIDRSAGGSGQTVVMFNKTQHKQEAWQYMQWWLSAKTQQQYATEIEALLGVSARWNTSNVNALRSLPWPRQDIQAIFDQWAWYRANPIVLGGYYTYRYIGNAWNNVVLSGKNPRESLESAVRDINTELEVKQVEFNVRAPKQGVPQLTEAGPSQ